MKVCLCIVLVGGWLYDSDSVYFSDSSEDDQVLVFFFFVKNVGIIGVLIVDIEGDEVVSSNQFELLFI